MLTNELFEVEPQTVHHEVVVAVILDELADVQSHRAVKISFCHFDELAQDFVLGHEATLLRLCFLLPLDYHEFGLSNVEHFEDLTVRPFANLLDDLELAAEGELAAIVFLWTVEAGHFLHILCEEINSQPPNYLAGWSNILHA